MNTELIARLEAAAEVTHALEVEFAAFMYANGATFAGVVSYDPELWLERNASTLSSLDAALSLAERVLPRAYVGLQQNRGVPSERSWTACVEYYDKEFEALETVVSMAKTPAIAICISILRALEAQEAV